MLSAVVPNPKKTRRGRDAVAAARVLSLVTVLVVLIGLLVIRSADSGGAVEWGRAVEPSAAKPPSTLRNEPAGILAPPATTPYAADTSPAPAPPKRPATASQPTTPGLLRN